MGTAATVPNTEKINHGDPTMNGIIGYYKGFGAYYQALWQHPTVRSLKAKGSLKSPVSLSFQKIEQPVWHKGHIVYYQTKFKAFLTYFDNNDALKTRQMAIAPFCLYTVEEVCGDYTVQPERGSNNNKSAQNYAVSSQSCTCPSFRHETGLIDSQCKHQRLLAAELKRAPWLERSIYTYPTRRPQPRPLADPEIVQLQPGYSPFPGCYLQYESADLGWDLLVRVKVEVNREIKDICVGRISQDNAWMTVYNRRRSIRIVASKKNVEIACRGLFQSSNYANYKIYDPDTVDLEDLSKAAIDLSAIGKPKVPVFLLKRTANGMYCFKDRSGLRPLTHHWFHKDRVNREVKKLLISGCRVIGQNPDTQEEFEATLKGSRLIWESRQPQSIR